jgi:hypothetical protein
VTQALLEPQAEVAPWDQAIAEDLEGPLLEVTVKVDQCIAAENEMKLGKDTIGR